MLELRSKPPSLTFLIRKVSKRISHRMHPFYFSEAFEDSQETFLEKFLASGGGDGSPNIQCAKEKHTAIAVCFLFVPLKLGSYTVVVRVDLFLVCFCCILEKSVKLCSVLSNGVGAGYNICRISLEEMTPHKLITCVVTA